MMRVLAMLLIALPIAAQADTVLISPKTAPRALPQVVPTPKGTPIAGAGAVIGCSPRTTSAALNNPLNPQAHTLADEPNAVLIIGVARMNGPCMDPIVVGRDIGNRPDLPAPAITGAPQALAVEPDPAQ